MLPGIRSARTRIILAIVLAILAAALVAWTWRHPTAFPPVAAEISTGSEDWPVDEALFVGMTYPFTRGEDTVTLQEVEANVVTNTADATVSFSICTLTGDGAIGSVSAADVEDLCSSLLPVADHRLTSDADPSEQLLIEITPRRAGTIEIAGASLTYGQGWQRGSQDVGERIRLIVR